MQGNKNEAQKLLLGPFVVKERRDAYAEVKKFPFA